MSRFIKNRPPTTMGPAQSERLARRSASELNGRKKLGDLCARIEAACALDEQLRLKAALLYLERKTPLEIAHLIGVPV